MFMKNTFKLRLTMFATFSFLMMQVYSGHLNAEQSLNKVPCLSTNTNQSTIFADILESSNEQCKKNKRCSFRKHKCPRHCRPCPTGPQGPTGLNGATGAAGPAFDNYISSYANQGQTIPIGPDGSTLTFDVIIATSGTIVNDSGAFTIPITGTYLIGWTLSSQVPGFSNNNLIRITLLNNSLPITISPNPNVIFQQVAQVHTASGQIIVDLSMNDVITLLVQVSQMGQGPGPNIINPTIFIEQIN